FTLISSSLHSRLHFFPFFFLLLPPPPRSTLFPYTTLFRSLNAPLAPNPAPTPVIACFVPGTIRGMSLPCPIQLLTLVNIGHGKEDRKSTRLNSSHVAISYAVFCLKKKKKKKTTNYSIQHRI